VASSEGLIIQASEHGKRKTLCQIFAVSALIIHYPFIGADAHTVGMVIIYIALALSILSGADYFIQFYDAVFKIVKK
jgi:CDP-diacylglycerol--glycerol-3-phosphate 3-phosphatidyltransferase